MTNRLFAEQISRQINFFAGNIVATKFFFVEETFDHVPGNEKDQVSPICRYRTNLGDFRHHRTMMLKVYINGHKTGENRGKELNNV